MLDLKEDKKALNRKNSKLEIKAPIKVIQFGEGNFLRAFIGYVFHELNKSDDFNAGIAVVQPIDRGLVHVLNEQDGLYTLFMKGVKKGQEIQEIQLISNIVKGIDPYTNFDQFLSLAQEPSLEFIISNTTEAGIAYLSSDTRDMQPPSSFPAKLVVLLHRRFKYFKGDESKGLTIIPCELINYNADTLKDIILKHIDDWKLGEGFKTWLLDNCKFHNTLVDKIVPGYPKNEIEVYNAQLDYSDKLIVAAEAFFLWVIEGGNDLKLKLPFDKTKLDVKIVKDMQPYRTRKVRILNGAHTSMVPFSILYGNKTVKQSIEDEFTGDFIKKAIFNEVIESLEMDRDELNDFANEVFDRFRNPFIIHNLSSIALNSISKFKVRVLPSLLDYVLVQGKLPRHLTFSFACLIRFYKGTWNGSSLPIDDNEDIIDKFSEIWQSNDFAEVAKSVLSIDTYWGEDLNKIENLTDAIALALKEIEINGIEQGFSNYSKKY